MSPTDLAALTPGLEELHATDPALAAALAGETERQQSDECIPK